MSEDTQTVDTEATFEQDLTSLMNPETAAKPDKAAEEHPPETSPAPVESSEVAETEPPAEPTIEDKLSKIEEPETKKEETPQLNPEQQKILSLIPNAQIAEQVQGLAQGYQNFTNMFIRGDFQNVEAELEAWNPEASEAFKEHLYQKNIETWVERWIQEKEGKADPAVKNLERQVQALRDEREREERTRAQQAHQARVAEIGKQYDSHIKNLFDLIEMAEPDRRWIRAAIDKLVGEDRSALHAINSGQMSAINPLFKQAVKEYVERDKSTAQTKAQQKEIEAKHKPLVSGATITPVQDEITDEMIRSANGDQLETLLEKKLDQGLSRIFSPKKK